MCHGLVNQKHDNFSHGLQESYNSLRSSSGHFGYTGTMRKARGFDSKKIIASLICALVGTQSLSAYAPESSFWSDRRRATQKQYASLASGFPTDKAVGPQSLAEQFPVPERIRESISSSISRQIPEPLLKSKAAVFSALSPAYGRVRKFSTATNGKDNTPIVIHIQDVHRNAEAQNNIREVVSRLLATGQVGLLALEGATEKIALQSYVDFPHPEAVRLAADYLLRENVISGPIHAALTAKQKLPPFSESTTPIFTRPMSKLIATRLPNWTKPVRPFIRFRQNWRHKKSASFLPPFSLLTSA